MRSLIWTIAACLAVLPAICIFQAPAQPAPPRPGSAQAKSSVAILELEPKGVPDVEVSALSDRLRGELIATGAFDVMERGKMQEILKEQGFQQSGACNTDACAIEVGQLIGVEKMIGGSLGKVGKTYSINLRLINVRTGRIERSIMRDYTGEIDRLLTTEMRIVAQQLAASVTGKGVAQPAAAGKPVYKKWWFWGGIGGAVAGGLVAALAGGKGGATPEQPPTEQPVEPPPTRP